MLNPPRTDWSEIDRLEQRIRDLRMRIRKAKNTQERLFPESLLAYLVSYRNHTGFHEACIERIYGDLLGCLNPTELVVWAGFVRRGGLDINPVRSMAPIKFLPPRLVRH